MGRPAPPDMSCASCGDKTGDKVEYAGKWWCPGDCVVKELRSTRGLPKPDPRTHSDALGQ